MHIALEGLLDSVNHIIFGKQQQIRLVVCCLLVRGHLIENVPVGKTTLAYILAKLLGLQFQRISTAVVAPILEHAAIP